MSGAHLLVATVRDSGAVTSQSPCAPLLLLTPSVLQAVESQLQIESSDETTWQEQYVTASAAYQSRDWAGYMKFLPAATSHELSLNQCAEVAHAKLMLGNASEAVGPHFEQLLCANPMAFSACYSAAALSVCKLT